MRLVDFLAPILADSSHHIDASFIGLSIDSRAIKVGEVFVAIRGENFDGHDFITKAIERGAGCIVVQQEVTISTKIPIITVADTREALLALAANYRKQWQIPMVAVTGSCGKTTCKNFIASIFGKYQNTLATLGNYNNLLGLPLTIFRLDASHHYGVFELGASEIGEIATLTKVLNPSISVITNVGASHIENMGGSIAAIASQKGDILRALAPNGTAILNYDDKYFPFWRGLLSQQKIFAFSADEHNCHIHDDDTLTVFSLSAVVATTNGYRANIIAAGIKISIEVNMLGFHNVINALAATLVALSLDVPHKYIQQGIAATAAAGGRLNLYKNDKCRFIDDSYNANPTSFCAAIDVLASYMGPKIILMGDMGELDKDRINYHQQVARYARDKGVSRLFCIGKLSSYAAAEFGGDARFYDSYELLWQDLVTSLGDSWTILIKGSRFTSMDYFTNKLKGLL